MFLKMQIILILTSMPFFILSNCFSYILQTHNEEVRGFVNKVASFLHKYHNETAALVSKVFHPTRGNLSMCNFCHYDNNEHEAYRLSTNMKFHMFKHNFIFGLLLNHTYIA